MDGKRGKVVCHLHMGENFTTVHFGAFCGKKLNICICENYYDW